MRRRGSCMYYADAGLLAVGNLITIDDWILDRDRSHCSVCVQQFYAFKRRHHCRTCGEVICSRCSKHRKLRLVELNVDLTARICTICVTAATLAARDVSAAPLRPTLLETPSSPVFAVPVLPWDDANLATWRLEVARQADTIQPEQDDTLKLLVHLVATSLRCPIVFLGLLDPEGLHVQASRGLDPSSDSLIQFCAPVWRHNATLVLSEADDAMLRDQGLRYFAGTPIVVEGVVLGALVAMDMEPHGSTNLSQRNTLESVARIAAEVLEQRAKEANQTPGPAETDLSLDVPEKSDVDESDGDGDGTAPCTPMNEFQKALYVSPRDTLCSDSNQTIELPSSAQHLPAYDDAVESMLQLYRILHGCSWEPTSVVVADRRVQFHTFHERYQHGYIKATRELTAMPGSPSWATLVQLPQMQIYSNCLAQYVSHQPIDGRTTMHNVVFQPGSSWTRAKQYPLLTHARDYPNGAAVYLGMQLRDDLVPEFCFGWMLSPSDDEGRAKISVIVPQHREIHEANMIANWLDKLQELAHAPREQRARSVDGPSHDVVAPRAARANTTDGRPATEAFFWTLLEQTISTQRLLSERQSDLMYTMETNGSRLHQLTEAVERVEWRLDQPL